MVSIRAFTAKHRSFVSNYGLEFAALLVLVNFIPISNLVAQLTIETPTIIQPMVTREIPVQKHLQLPPGQAIDIRNLPADVLNCDECRRRLGLPPLSKPIVELKAEVATKATPKADQQKDEEAAAKPTLKQLGQPIEEPGMKTAAPDALRVEGVLTSPATQRIEIEILKRQLQERDAHLKQFSEMQSNVEDRIDQLVRMNEELAKKDAGRQTEIDRIQKSSEQTLQARELELSNLRADLGTVRADAIEKTKRLNDQLIELESTKAKELAKLSGDLIEAKQARIDAVANLRKEFASSKDEANSETVKMIAEQRKTLESQQEAIANLEEQLAKAEKVRREDADRLEKTRNELRTVTAERTKALNELAKPLKLAEDLDKTVKAQKIETAKATPSAVQPGAKETAKGPTTEKAMEPAKTSPVAEQQSAKLEQNPAPIENEENKKRRAF